MLFGNSLAPVWQMASSLLQRGTDPGLSPGPQQSFSLPRANRLETPGRRATELRRTRAMPAGPPADTPPSESGAPSAARSHSWISRSVRKCRSRTSCPAACRCSAMPCCLWLSRVSQPAPTAARLAMNSALPPELTLRPILPRSSACWQLPTIPPSSRSSLPGCEWWRSVRTDCASRSRPSGKRSMAANSATPWWTARRSPTSGPRNRETTGW